MSTPSIRSRRLAWRLAHHGFRLLVAIACAIGIFALLVFFRMVAS